VLASNAGDSVASRLAWAPRTFGVYGASLDLASVEVGYCSLASHYEFAPAFVFREGGPHVVSSSLEDWIEGANVEVDDQILSHESDYEDFFREYFVAEAVFGRKGAFFPSLNLKLSLAEVALGVIERHVLAYFGRDNETGYLNFQHVTNEEEHDVDRSLHDWQSKWVVGFQDHFHHPKNH